MNPWVLGLLFGLFGLGASEVSRFERDSARDIYQQLEGPKRRVSIVARYPGILSPALGEVDEVIIRASHFKTDGLPLFTEPERSTAGSIRWLRLDLQDATLKGLRIDQLKADIPDCRFDFQFALRKRKIRLSRSGTGTGSVRILAADLQTFILKKYHEIKKCTVEFRNGKVKVTGQGEFLVFNAAFEITARLKTDGTKLELTDAEILFDGKLADDNAKQALLDTMNPVVDLDADLQLFGAITLEQITLENGVLLATGRTKIPVRKG